MEPRLCLTLPSGWVGISHPALRPWHEQYTISSSQNFALTAAYMQRYQSEILRGRADPMVHYRTRNLALIGEEVVDTETSRL